MKSWEFDEVDAFTTGTTGRPGQRVFFLQARVGADVVSLKCEKQQVSALAEYVARLLKDLPPPSNRPMPAALELRAPVDAGFVIGPMGLVFDAELDLFVLMVEEAVALDEDGEPDLAALGDQGRLRLRLSRGQAAAFCERAAEIVSAGRPNCLFCGMPIDPDGHPCPRMN
jgi:uncharacterized repeat protein (TIGR03847 family)